MQMYKFYILATIGFFFKINAQSQCSHYPNLTHGWDIAFPAPDECMTAEHDQNGKPYLYVAGKERGLLIYDLSGTSPILVDSVTVNMLDTLELMNISQDGNYLYLALGNIFVNSSVPGMAIVDVSNPAGAVLKTVWKYPTQSGGAGIVKTEGNYAYLGAMRRGLMILDITNKSNVSLVSVFKPDITYPNPTNPDSNKYNARGMEVRNNFVYLCDDAGAFRIIDVTNKTTPVEVGHYSNPAVYNKARAYNNIILNDTVAFIAVDYCGMELLNIADPAHITPVSWWNPWNCDSPSNTWWNSPGYANEIRYDSTCKIVFLSTGRGEVHTVNVSDIMHPDSCQKYTTTSTAEGTWGLGLYQGEIYACYIKTVIPFYSSWSGIKMLSWDDNCSTSLTSLQKPTFNIYPNPTDGEMNINTAGCRSISIIIYDMLGQKKYSSDFCFCNKTIHLQLGQLNNGNYIMQIVSDGSVVNRPFSIIK
jgi:hypothetical protein